MNAFRKKFEDWIDRTQDRYIFVFAFLVAVAPVLLVSGWFYVRGN